WPNVQAVFQTYHLMVAMWGLMAVAVIAGLWHWKRLETSPWTLKLLIASVFFPQVANQAGWVTAEMGRYPWIVYGLLRISDGLNKTVKAEQIMGSIVMFGLVYALLFLLFLYLLNEKIKHGPIATEKGDTYHQLHAIAEEIKKDEL